MRPAVQQTVFNRDDTVLLIPLDIFSQQALNNWGHLQKCEEITIEESEHASYHDWNGNDLIVLLSYAVYSNTVDSEYYEYTTTNEHNSMDLTQESDGLAQWYFTTTDAITWVNFTVYDAPPDSTLIVEAEGTNWSHSPNLGLNDQSYVCNEPSSDYSDILDTCEYSRTHTMELANGSGTLRGRVSLELPIKGKGYLESENIERAQEEADSLISSAQKTITWKVKVVSDGETSPSAGMLVESEFSSHELVSLSKFKINPVQETVYSFSALVGCFFLVLVIPLMIYFSARYRENLNESKEHRSMINVRQPKVRYPNRSHFSYELATLSPILQTGQWNCSLFPLLEKSLH